jgi:hypothetical protein
LDHHVQVLIVFAQPPPIPITPPIILCVALLASIAVFVTLTRRWTSRRVRVALVDWARDNGFRLSQSSVTLPPPLIELANPDLRTHWTLFSDTTTIIQLIRRSPTTETMLNLLIRRTISDWPPTALRPAGISSSAIDLFSLQPFPLLPVNERYTLLGTDVARARQLANSHAAGLLPPELGLILHGPLVLLDFSARPFDGIEFGRMILLADQLEKVIGALGGQS